MIGKIKEYLFRLKVQRLPNVAIDRSAEIRYSRLRIAPSDTLRVGSNSTVHASIISDRSGAKILIGCGTFIGASHIISATEINIGDNVLISWGCYLVDHDSHSIDPELRKNDGRLWGKGAKSWENVATEAIRIEDGVWIGFNAIILKGVTVGAGSVVAAGSIVTKNVPPYTVVAGNPARIIREMSNGTPK